MAQKYIFSVLLVSVIAAVTLGEPARFHSRSSRFQLARQEAAQSDRGDEQTDIAPTPATAPYPPAGVTPEIPFDLPSETEAQPDLTYGPPENTYGPPAEDSASQQSDNTYGPPDSVVPVDQEPTQVDDLSVATDAVAQSLIQPRNSRLRNRRPVPEKLRSAQFIRSKPVLVYSL